MPVGTAATVKAMTARRASRATGADILLGNTYHLMLRPGAERVARLGGLHRFMGWDRPILTDSGGFQVMSLSDLRKLHRGGRHLPQPHRRLASTCCRPSARWRSRRLLGSDIVMASTNASPARPTRGAAREVDGAVDALGAALARRLRRRAPTPAPCSASSRARLDEDLRREVAEALNEIGFDGYAIGGLAVGEGQEAMFERARLSRPAMLPDDRPRYLMGVGKPDDLVGAVVARRRHVRLRAADPLGPHTARR